MYRRPVTLAAGLLLATFPASALAQSGGAAAPDTGGGTVSEQAGGTPAHAPRLRASQFTVSAGSVQIGQPLRFSWRVDGPVRRIRARVALLPAGGGKALSIALGTRRAGTRNVRTWTPRAGHVAPGSYTARLHATGARGAKLRRTARASGRLTLEVTAPPAPPAAAVRPRGTCSRSRAPTAWAATRRASARAAPATSTRART